MKKALILGATGVMGQPLVRLLSASGEWQVSATSRRARSDAAVRWIRGDGHDIAFLRELLSQTRYDCVADFLNYGTESFRERYELFLNNVGHYIFLSSARVYAPHDGLIDETSPRLLDVSRDADYLRTDPYELAKAREENLLNDSRAKNYTIIRPSLTYGSHRMQFTLFEMEEWLYRVLDGNSVIFPEDMAEIRTTMTRGEDVARLISRLALNEKAFGETFNINGGGSLTWGEILRVYVRAIQAERRTPVKVCAVADAGKLARELGRYSQYRYARGIHRTFSNQKIAAVVGEADCVPITEGLTQAVRQFLRSGDRPERYRDFRTVAKLDRIAGERTALRRFDSVKHKIAYFATIWGGGTAIKRRILP